MRTSTAQGYLTTGIAYAFHPHRDTRQSAPFSQLNWWLPIYPITADNGLAFHPRYWYTPVKNSSRVYNYTEWNATKLQTSPQAKSVPTLGSSLSRKKKSNWIRRSARCVSPVGSSFSQVPSCTQTSGTRQPRLGSASICVPVHIDDAAAGIGAPNIDSGMHGSPRRALSALQRSRTYAR